jgi:hypothetical protein
VCGLFCKAKSKAFAIAIILLPLLDIHCAGNGGPGKTLTYPYAAIVGAVGQGIPPAQPTVTGVAAPRFLVVPALPDGLALDPANGTIAGTPTGPSTPNTYTVSAAGPAGSASTAIQITVEPPGTVLNQLLTFQTQTMQHADWCWAADGSCILTFLGHPQPQCVFANATMQVDYCCNAPSTFVWTDYADPTFLELFGAVPSTANGFATFEVATTGQSSPLTFAQIQAEIGANRPFMFRWLRSDGSHHQLVGLGWDLRNGLQQVIYMDPWPGQGLTLSTYGNLLSGSDAYTNLTHTWIESLTFNP